MLYILFTTGQCNLKCRYCGGSFPQKLVPWTIGYSINELKRFISSDPDPVIAFYGGEPLLNVKFIREVMKNFNKVLIQTNGILARKLEPQYWLKFNAVLLSIDGRRTLTDYYRGEKVYSSVVDSARWLRTVGFRNDLIARMTVSERTDIFLDVIHLLSLNLFDHIHWQLDVVWSSRWKNFQKWCDYSYLPGISKLISLWIREARKGRVLGFVPFIAILGMMITNRIIDRPPCGAGVTSLSILTDGSVIVCPIAVDVKWAKLGSILENSNVQRLNRIQLNESCTSCKYLRYCGGRCLYTHYEKVWKEEEFNKICEVTIYTIDELAKIKNEVLKLLNSKIISMEQLNYPEYNNTTEIIP